MPATSMQAWRKAIGAGEDGEGIDAGLASCLQLIHSTKLKCARARILTRNLMAIKPESYNLQRPGVRRQAVNSLMVKK